MLEETELREEQLVQLKVLAHSPGWSLLQARLRQRLESKERDKADFLLKNKLHEAVILQGYTNALNDVGRVLESYMDELQVKVNSDEPAY